MYSYFSIGMFSNLNGSELTNKLYDIYGPIVKLGAFLGSEPLLLLADAEGASQVHIFLALK